MDPFLSLRINFPFRNSMSDFCLALTSILFVDDDDDKGNKPIFKKTKLASAMMASRCTNLVLFANIVLLVCCGV